MSIPSKSNPTSTEPAHPQVKRAHVQAETDEILGELYAVKANMNREARYDVSVLLAAALAEQQDDKRKVH